MDVRFHCSKRIRHSGKKAKHRVFDACPTVCQALRLHPFYGDSIPGFHDLRKMRLRVPGYNVGKRDGYRLIYRAREMDQAIHVVFLETYAKSDCADLSRTTNTRFSCARSRRSSRSPCSTIGSEPPVSNPPPPQSLDALLARAADFALFSMRSGGKVPPTLLADTPDGPLFFVPSTRRDERVLKLAMMMPELLTGRTRLL